jgi:hypothetical protein
MQAAPSIQRRLALPHSIAAQTGRRRLELLIHDCGLLNMQEMKKEVQRASLFCIGILIATAA